MAAHVTKWTNKGSNTDIGAYTNDDAVPADNNIMRHECHLWMDGTADIDTYPITFPIVSDLTIVMNATKAAIAADAGDVDVDMIGSIDGENYVELQTNLIENWDAGGGLQAVKMGYGVYDIDTYGVLPYMKLRVQPQNDANATVGVKINITPV